MHSVWYTEVGDVSYCVLRSTCGLVWKGCKSPWDCINVRNAELTKWLPLPQGTLVTVVLFKIFHRRNAVCEYVCIVTFRFWILQFLNCVDGLNTFVYVLSVFQQQVFHFFFVYCSPLNMFVNCVQSFHDFWEVILCHCVGGSQRFAGIIPCCAVVLWVLCPSETVSHLRRLNPQLRCCKHLHSKLCHLCYVGQWSRILWFSWLIFLMYWRFTQWNVSDSQALTEV